MINDSQHVVEVWLTNAESADPVIQEKLRQLYAKYKHTLYSVVVYHSGHQDLYRNTLDLLIANRLYTAKTPAPTLQ